MKPNFFPGPLGGLLCIALNSAAAQTSDDSLSQSNEQVAPQLLFPARLAACITRTALHACVEGLQQGSKAAASEALPENTTSAIGSSEQEKDTNPEVFWLWRHARVSGGQLTLPFKIRRSSEHNTFRLTTDVTLGGYVGYTRQLSQTKNIYLTIPLTAGLAFINLDNNNTVRDLAETDAEVVPGLSWSTGLILQLEQFSLGLLMGKDYASEVGDQWEYHKKLWWSFGIGFSFTGGE